MKNILSLFLFSLIATPFLSAQWLRQYPLEKLESVLDIAIHEDGYGFAVGGNDLILKLDPGTNRFELLTTWDKKWKLESVDYLPFTSGDIVAAGGQGLIVSENGGFNWQEIAGAPAGIHAIKMFSATDIMVSSDVGVFRWKNNSWQDLSPVTSGIQGAFILDDQHIWAFTNGANPIIYYTSNGGQNWNQNSEINRPDVVKFYTAQYGIATDGRMVYKSVDGGQHWTLMSNNVIANTSSDLTFGENPNVLMSASPNANPSISQDSGKTWTNVPTGLINLRSYSVAALNDQEFWLGDDLSTVAYTSDAGANWIETSGPTRSIVNDVHFLDRTHGFAVGFKGLMLRTEDGGINWEDISSTDTRSFLAIHGLTSNDLWIGTNQRILHSNDNGDTWVEKGILPGGNVNDILAISSSRILAVTSSGYIFRSVDSGASWDTVFITTGQMRSVSKIDNQRYMATGFNGIIVRSDDQGATWHSVTIPEPGLQYEQSYFTGSEGWLVTSSFKKSMWHTSNNGDAWDTITLPIDRFWDGVFFITPDTGVIVGHNTGEGRAYVTFNGGSTWQSGYILPFALTGVTGTHNPNGTAWIFGSGSDIEILPYCNTLPKIGDFAGDLSPCESDTITYTISSQDAEQFYWYLPPGWHFIGNSNNDTITVETGTGGGVIRVLATNICGYSDQLINETEINPLPQVTKISGPNVVCGGEEVMYTVEGNGADEYHWIYPPTWTILGDSTSNELHAVIGTAGLLQVYGTNSCGASEVIEADIVKYILPSKFSFDIHGDTLSIPEIGSGYQYQWYLNGVEIPGATNPTYVVTSSGVYAIRIIANGDCFVTSVPAFIAVTATEGVESNRLITVRPSPADDLIDMVGASAGDRFAIYNMWGQRVMFGELQQTSVDVSSLIPGVYSVLIDGRYLSGKGRFVKK